MPQEEAENFLKGSELKEFYHIKAFKKALKEGLWFSFFLDG